MFLSVRNFYPALITHLLCYCSSNNVLSSSFLSFFISSCSSLSKFPHAQLKNKYGYQIGVAELMFGEV